MPQQAVTMESLPRAFEVVKEMPAGGLGRGLSPARPPGAGRGDGPLARHPRWQRPARPALSAERAQRATHPARLPDLEVLKSCARRAPEIDRAILAGFVPGLSTRKAGEVLLALPGRPVPAATVSRVARTLDLSLAAFHRRPLKNACKLDGVVLARKACAREPCPGGARHPPRRHQGDSGPPMPATAGSARSLR